jgi:hypothetical protein
VGDRQADRALAAALKPASQLRIDVQFLLGAGAETTLTYLTGHGHADIARELLAYPELHEDLQAWTAFRRSYF